MADRNIPFPTDTFPGFSPNVPGGYKANDLIVVFIYVSMDAGDFFPGSQPIFITSGPGSGWIELGQDEIAMAADAGDRFAVFYYPVLADGAVNPVNYGWGTGTGYGNYRQVVYRNVDPVTPILLSQPIQINVAGDPVDIPLQVTTLANNATVVVAAGARTDPTVSTRMSFGVPTMTYRTQVLTNDPLSLDGGGFPSYGSYPDIGISGADPGTSFNVMSVGDYSSEPAGVQNVVASCAASPIVAAGDRRGMGIIFALNPAS